jgi:hypothetical protein
MPLLENLAEGFANAAGATGAAQSIEKNKQRRQNLSDQELEDTVQAHMDVMKGIQAKLGQNPNDAQLQQALSGERDQLFQLLHPANNPDALGRVKKLFRHIFRQREPQPNQPVNNLPSVAAMTAGAPMSKEDQEFAGFSPEDKNKAMRIRAGLDPRATTEKPDPENWTVVTGVTSDGKPFTFQHNSKNHESLTLDGKPIPPEQLQGFTVPPKGSAGPRVGTLGEFLINAYGPHPTAVQEAQGRALWAQANAGTTVGEHVVMVPQVDGSIKPVTVVTTSHKEFGTGGAPTKPTKAAGEQKKDLQNMTKKSAAGVASVGDAVGGKRTTAQNKADNDFVEATKLASVADQVAQKPDDAINQKRLAVSLERASAGRFTTQALDYIIKAGWGNTIEQWANNPSTGALPRDVMRQLVDGAHENLKAAKAARDAAFGESGSSGTTGKKHSLKKAMALPINQGKSADEVRTDLKNHGYEVIEDAASK